MAEAFFSNISACRYLKVVTGSVWPLLNWWKTQVLLDRVATSCRWQSWFEANTFCRCANTSLGVGAKPYTSELGMLCSPTLHTITQQQILFPDTSVVCCGPVVRLWATLLRCVFRPALMREQHYQYLKKGLRHLSDAYEVQYYKLKQQDEIQASL